MAHETDPHLWPEGYLENDLPGAWSKSDFEGGDPDERSYAEREGRTIQGERVTIAFIDEAQNLVPNPSCDLPFRIPTPFVDEEPVGYDGFGAPLYAWQAFKSDAIWTIPESATFEVRNVDPELMELIYGQPVIPLCQRQIPERGTE